MPLFHFNDNSDQDSKFLMKIYKIATSTSRGQSQPSLARIVQGRLSKKKVSQSMDVVQSEGVNHMFAANFKPTQMEHFI